MSLRAALGRSLAAIWCGLTHDPFCRCYQPRSAPAPSLTLPEGLRFDWLRDYGPLWQPGSTAFWLEPETHDELAAWYAKYWPNVTGFVEAAGLRIEIVPRRPPLLERYPYSQNASQLGLYQNQLQNAAFAQLQNPLALSNYYQNSLRNKLPGGWN